MAAEWTVIGVPIDSVGQASGTELAPAALREIGLPSALGAQDRGDLDVRIRDPERDAESGVVGLTEVVAMTRAVREAVSAAVVDGARPLLLGGCCALLPGALGGIRDALGETGTVYLDGHVDVYDGHTSPTRRERWSCSARATSGS